MRTWAATKCRRSALQGREYSTIYSHFSTILIEYTEYLLSDTEGADSCALFHLSTSPITRPAEVG